MMMKILKIILFIVLTCFLCSYTGMFIGAYAARNIIGLDANLKALEYGMAGAFIGLLSGLILPRMLSALWFRRVFVSVCTLSVIIGAFIAYKVIFKKPEQKDDSFNQDVPVSKTSVGRTYHFAGYYDNGKEELPIGTGVAQPHLIPGKSLYFYGYNAFFSMPEDLIPADSITFKKGPHYIEIAAAPPWLVPEVLKLDYDAFYLRTLTVSKNWLEVVVNNTTGQTAWISRNAAEFIDWHDFLLNVVAIELIDEKKNPLRLKPLDHAGILATPPPRFQLKPLAIRGDWIMVATNGLADRIPPAGWIRWRNESQILIRYSILS